MPNAVSKEPKRSKQRTPRKTTAAKKVKKSTPTAVAELPAIAAPVEASPAADVAPVAASESQAAVPAKKAARKTAARSRRPRKTASESSAE
jgi:hypothetical protein